MESGRQAPATASPAAASGAGPEGRLGGRAGEGLPAAAAAPTLRQVRVEALMNVNYHAAREGFLDGTHRVLMFLIIVVGASAIVDLGTGVGWLKEVAAATGAALAALDLTCDLSNRARAHATARRDYSDVLARVDADEISLTDARARFSRIGADEEPAYAALLNACWNAACLSVYGDDSAAVAIPASHRLLRNLIAFSGVVYPDAKRAEPNDPQSQLPRTA